MCTQAFRVQPRLPPPPENKNKQNKKHIDMKRKLYYFSVSFVFITGDIKPYSITHFSVAQHTYAMRESFKSVFILKEKLKTR